MTDKPSQPAETGPERPAEAPEAPSGDQDGAQTPETPEIGSETFSRAYVEKLRAENAEHRTKAKRAEVLASRLLAATVEKATTGILADPTDLPVSDDLYDDDGFPDADKITEAARALVERKPHLADRRPSAPVEQGPRGQPAEVDLAGMVRSLAG